MVGSGAHGVIGIEDRWREPRAGVEETLLLALDDGALGVSLISFMNCWMFIVVDGESSMMGKQDSLPESISRASRKSMTNEAQPPEPRRTSSGVKEVALLEDVSS